MHPIGRTGRLEASARSMCDGIAVWVREMQRPENERSPTVLAHEVARSQRMADHFEARVSDPLMQGPPGMAHLILAVALILRASAVWVTSPANIPGLPLGCSAFATCPQCRRPRYREVGRAHPHGRLSKSNHT